MDRRNEAVKQHALDADVIMEVLDIAESRGRTSHMHMERRGAVSGDRAAETRRDCRSFEESRESLAASCVELQNIDGLGLEHAPEVEGVVAIFAGRDVHAAGSAVANPPQIGEMI